VAKQPITLAEKIYIARNRLGEDQDQFGKRFDVTRFAVIDWEKGTTKPRRPEHKAKLKQIFTEMFGDEDEDSYESVAYQLVLPFDDPVKLEFRVLPQSETSVRFSVEARRRKAV
jgi:DNA-binding XRE family transcriptional regulator